MSEGYPEQQPGGSFLTRRVMGMPAWAWLILAGGATYLLFFRGKGGGGTSTGGGGSSATGDTTFAGSPVSVTVDAGHGTPNPQPSPKPPPKKKVISHPVLTYKVKPGDTLASVAKKYGISVATLAHANVYVPGEVPGDKKVGQPLGTGAGLKTGQVLKIPQA